MQFEPNEMQLAWAQFVLDAVNQDGEWIAPSTGQRYIFDHRNHKIELQNPEVLSDPLAVDWHFKNAATFAKLGYSVTEKGARAA